MSRIRLGAKIEVFLLFYPIKCPLHCAGILTRRGNHKQWCRACTNGASTEGRTCHQYLLLQKEEGPNSSRNVRLGFMEVSY